MTIVLSEMLHQRIVSGVLLHTTLDTVGGIAPVIIFVPVTFFSTNHELFLQAVKVVLHHGKSFRVEGLLSAPDSKKGIVRCSFSDARNLDKTK